MTDHSLGAYLRRRTTKELEDMLAYCLQEDNYVNYEQVILEILSIFYEQDAQETAIKG